MENILRYTYGTAEIARSRVWLRELDDLKISAGFTNEDRRYRRLAGGVLADQTKQIVDHWRRAIIASIPNLARALAYARGRSNPRIHGCTTGLVQVAPAAISPEGRPLQ